MINNDGSYTYTVNNDNTAVQALRTSGDTLDDVFTYTMDDSGGLDSTAQLTVTIQGANDAPVAANIEVAALTYTENDGAVAITSAITLNDADDTDLESAVIQITSNYVDGEDVLSFTAQNDIGGSFDTSTGVMTLTGSATAAEYQAAISSIVFTNSNENPSTNARTVSITVNDGDADSNTQTRDIAVTSVNDAPTFTSTAVTAATEDAAFSYAITASEVDIGDSLTITSGTIPGWLTLTDNSDGTASLAGTPSNDEVGSHNVVLDVNDGAVTTSQTFTIVVANTNDAPTFTSTTVTSATEDVAYSYAITTNDVDLGDSLTITATTMPAWLTFTDNGDGTGGLAGTPTNDEVGNHNVVLDLNDGTVTVAQSFTVVVGNTNDAPVIISDGGGSDADIFVDENQTSVTTVRSTDADRDATLTYSLSGGEDQFAFTVNSNSGALSFSAAPNHEVKDSFEVEVTVSDGSSTDVQSLIVTVNDVNEFSVITPLDGDGRTGAVVSEGLPVGSPVGITATASDADKSMSTIRYALTDNADEFFTMNEATGVISLAQSLNAEDTHAHILRIVATSEDGSTSTNTFIVQVTDVNEFEITQVIDSQFEVGGAVLESSALGTDVGIVAMFTDADVTDNKVTYSLIGNLDGAFAINPESGVVTVAGKLDAELRTTHLVLVLTTSADGSTTSVTLYVQVIDENDNTPFLTAYQQSNVAENSVEGVDVGDVNASDFDVVGMFSDWRIEGGSGQGIFNIDPDNGVLSVAADAALDFEMQDEYSILISISDTLNRSETVQAIVHVTDVNEAPSIASVTFTVLEGYYGQLGTISATDVDDGDRLGFSITEYGEVLTNDQVKLQNSGLLSVSNLPVGVHNVTIQVTDLDGLTASTDIRINVEAEVTIETIFASAQPEPVQNNSDLTVEWPEGPVVTETQNAPSEFMLDSAEEEPDVHVSSEPSVHQDGFLYYENVNTLFEPNSRKQLSEIAANDPSQQYLQFDLLDSYNSSVNNNGANASFSSQRSAAVSLSVESDPVSLAAALNTEAFTNTSYDELSRALERKIAEVNQNSVREEVSNEAREYIANATFTVVGGSVALGSTIWLLRSGVLVATVVRTRELLRPLDEVALLSPDENIQAGLERRQYRGRER